MNRARRVGIAVASLTGAWVFACDTQGTVERAKTPTDTTVDVAFVGDVDVASLSTRGRKRMDVDMLGASLRRVTDGIGWTTMAGGKEVDELERLAATLGRPDFVETTEEELQPTTMFQKFLSDGAKSVCRRLVDRDLTRAKADRVLLGGFNDEFIYSMGPERFDAHMQELVLRFHSQVYRDDDSRLEEWRFLHTSATQLLDGDAFGGWQIVCIGLITHPDFYLY